jgi:DNA-binding transcriptional LysR family regulator
MRHKQIGGRVALDLFRLQIFVNVVDRNGYSAAARHMHLAQATVSRHVQELERELGAELLRYEQRAVHLTGAGREVYQAARGMIQEEENLERALRDLRRGRRGQVRVGASMAFEQNYFFQRVIAPFRKTHEDETLSLRFGHSGREARAVIDHELDLAYVIKWELPPDSAFEPLHTARFRFLAPRDHPLSQKDTVTVDDIIEAGLITAPFVGMESAFYDMVLRDCGINGEHSVLEVDGVQARAMAAEAGLGVFGTFYPDYAGEATIGNLVPLRFEGPSPRVEIGILEQRRGGGSTSVQAFANWLRNLPGS